ncbi:uncharacterized protein LAJ45_04912 [Morchella importuna]|uniref:uncharacterized protein n=1 Tax=Morchella importuna TaxID=1174673 RepID=UPI001E8D6C1B|nr:uncharacterized protein LAJ45_04912 [Morchella importuna]KAH8151210.1 hypothetical protein LAJ45_04912 [Morchella importuna]
MPQLRSASYLGYLLRTGLGRSDQAKVAQTAPNAGVCVLTGNLNVTLELEDDGLGIWNLISSSIGSRLAMWPWFMGVPGNLIYAQPWNCA